MSVCLSLYLFASVSVCVCLSGCLSAFVSVCDCESVSLSVCVSLCLVLSVCLLSVCLSACLMRWSHIIYDVFRSGERLLIPNRLLSLPLPLYRRCGLCRMVFHLFIPAHKIDLLHYFI